VHLVQFSSTTFELGLYGVNVALVHAYTDCLARLHGVYGVQAGFTWRLQQERYSINTRGRTLRRRHKTPRSCLELHCLWTYYKHLRVVVESPNTCQVIHWRFYGHISYSTLQCPMRMHGVLSRLWNAVRTSCRCNAGIIFELIVINEIVETCSYKTSGVFTFTFKNAINVIRTVYIIS